MLGRFGSADRLEIAMLRLRFDVQHYQRYSQHEVILDISPYDLFLKHARHI
jgi:hypothetical protein